MISAKSLGTVLSHIFTMFRILGINVPIDLSPGFHGHYPHQVHRDISISVCEVSDLQSFLLPDVPRHGDIWRPTWARLSASFSFNCR